MRVAGVSGIGANLPQASPRFRRGRWLPLSYHLRVLTCHIVSGRVRSKAITPLEHPRAGASRTLPDRARRATGTTHRRLTTTSPCTERIHSDDPRSPPLSRYPSFVLSLTKSGGTD